MKYLLIALYLILSFLRNSFGDNQNNVITSFQSQKYSDINIKLAGKVKSVLQCTSYPQTGLSDTIIYLFDNAGLPEKIEQIESYFGIREVYSFYNGQLVSVKSFLNNDAITETILKYDSLSRLIQRTDFSVKMREPSLIETFQYDSIGHMYSYSMDNLAGKIFKKWVYKYDIKGNKVEEGSCDNYKGIKHPSDCKYMPLHGYRYNEKNQLIVKFDKGSWSPHNTDSYYQYDINGNEISAMGYYITTDTILGYHYVYQYDEYNNKVMEEEKVGDYRIIDFNKFKFTTFQYDNHLNLVQEEYLTSENVVLKIIRFDYTYDECGNWTKREKQEGKTESELKPVVVEYRWIEYY